MEKLEQYAHYDYMLGRGDMNYLKDLFTLVDAVAKDMKEGDPYLCGHSYRYDDKQSAVNLLTAAYTFYRLQCQKRFEEYKALNMSTLLEQHSVMRSKAVD